MSLGGDKSDGGFAFLLALALLATLSGAVVLIQSIGFATASDAAIEIRQGSARLILDGAMRRQIEQVLLSGTVDPNAITGRADAPGGTLSFQLGFADGRVDVNSAPPELIKLALRAGGTDTSTIEAVLAATAELRKRRAAVADPVQLFPVEIRLAGRPAREQSRFLTALSGSRGVNLSVSERELLNQVAPDSAAAFAPGAAASASLPPGPWQGWLTSNRTTISLTGAYRHSDGWTLRRKAVFRIDRARHAVQILAWRTL
jgi:hypothetical protein